ncbi:MAG: efflux transporter periplasmic adaptor subunit, partial [Brachymonas sp.]|nr:efflux transporter periplasmic adaptor subunit [Brachymonas sp.]
MKKPVSHSLLALVIAVTAGSGLLVACKSKSGAADAASAARPALTVQVTTVQQGQVPLALKASGNIAAWQDVSIASQSMGLRLA